MAALAAAIGPLHLLLHVLQQEHYENARLRLWVKRHRTAAWTLPATAALLAAGALAADHRLATAAACVAGLLGAIRSRRIWQREQIKPLVFTARAKRVYVASLALIGIPPLLCAALISGDEAITIAAWLVAGELLTLHRVLATAIAVCKPIDRVDSRRFVRRARRRLNKVRPVVVGITGSYGKTTTKACVAEVLELLGPSYPTPASYNSYLGVVRAINEGLASSHRSFVAEMGAYRRGDIAQLCELVKPTIGILTAVGPAHLERFGTIDEIERAKGELAEALPLDGLFVTRADDHRCLRVAKTRATCRALLFAGAPHREADIWAEDIRVEGGRTTFELCARGETEPLRAVVTTKLLGEHNVANLLAAATVGIGHGLAFDEVARSLARVSPPAHRLAPIINPTQNVVVIDDSYNANPQGAAAALAVLGAHSPARRVMVTPGMVELGEAEDAENTRLGELAAGHCDRVILIGESRAASIRAGLLRAGFGEDDIVMAPDAKTAHRIVAETTEPGDVILFENDLPDVYLD